SHMHVLLNIVKPIPHIFLIIPVIQHTTLPCHLHNCCHRGRARKMTTPTQLYTYTIHCKTIRRVLSLHEHSEKCADYRSNGVITAICCEINTHDQSKLVHLVSYKKEKISREHIRHM